MLGKNIARTSRQNTMSLAAFKTVLIFVPCMKYIQSITRGEGWRRIFVVHPSWLLYFCVSSIFERMMENNIKEELFICAEI
jgi:hypothetical protein